MVSQQPEFHPLSFSVFSIFFGEERININLLLLIDNIEGYHGQNGPLSVEDPAWHSELMDVFKKAGLELGYDFLDLNGANQTGTADILFIPL